MHRETLSRTLLYSHNILGKSVVPLNYRGSSVLGKIPNIQQSPTRFFQTTWKGSVQSVTMAAQVEAKEGDPKSSRPADKVNNEMNAPPKFNLRAKDILSMPDPDDSPGLKDSPPIKAHEVSDVRDNLDRFDSRIITSRSVDELLHLSTIENMTLKHACLIVSRLGQISMMRPEHHARVSERILSDMRFVQIFNLIQRGNHSQSPHTLLNALSGLQKLGLEDSPETVRLLERELSWSMRRCPLRFLTKSVRILHENSLNEQKVSGSGKDEGILDSAVKVLNRRWIEAISGSDFIDLFRVINLFDDEKKLKIEERAADLAHQFSASEIARLFITLGMKKRRPTPLLRALSFHFSKSEHKLSAKECIELIYALNELTFSDPILMNRLCMDIVEDIPNINNVALISSLMTSLGQMRYKHKEILLVVDEWIMKHLNDLRVFDFAVWLQSAATLGHQSENIPAFCESAQRVLTQSSASSPTEWVNIVYSFVVLRQFNAEMLSSVLNPNFVESLEKLGVKATKQKVKLLNLNHEAKTLSGKGYKGPLLGNDKIKEWTAIVSSSDDKLSKLMVESLGSFLPAEKYLQLSCQLESGVFIDAVCHVDSKMKPVTLQVAKAQPSTTRKVAFVVEGYPALCLGQKDRTGQSSLNIKILEDEQYLIIPVPYTQFGHSDKLVRRVQYLEQKLKNVSQSSSESVVGGRNP